MLVGQFSPRCLRPYHERVHGSLHVGFLLLRDTTRARRSRHERPVVPFEYPAHGLSDTGLGFFPEVNDVALETLRRSRVLIRHGHGVAAYQSVSRTPGAEEPFCFSRRFGHGETAGNLPVALSECRLLSLLLRVTEAPPTPDIIGPLRSLTGKRERGKGRWRHFLAVRQPSCGACSSWTGRRCFLTTRCQCLSGCTLSRSVVAGKKT